MTFRRRYAMWLTPPLVAGSFTLAASAPPPRAFDEPTLHDPCWSIMSNGERINIQDNPQITVTLNPVHHQQHSFQPRTISKNGASAIVGAWKAEANYVHIPGSLLSSDSIARSSTLGQTWLWLNPGIRYSCQIVHVVPGIIDIHLMKALSTTGPVEDLFYTISTCDDAAEGGCENPGGGPAADPDPYHTTGGNGQVYEQSVSYRCEVYYEYDLQTGAILYYNVLGCYPYIQ